jgi:sugar/nucleoside kinase (ribokinase family)
VTAPLSAAAPGLLLGPASIDRYLDEQRDLPGGGALNMAYHWSQVGLPFRFLTRVGADDGEVVLAFLRRHGIDHLPGSITAPGVTASIDVVFRADRQPHGSLRRGGGPFHSLPWRRPP